MAREIDRYRGEASRLAAKHMPSRAARAATRRKLERGAREVGRRVRNATLTFVGLLLLLILAAVTGFVGLGSGILAFLAIGLISFLVLFLPTRRRSVGPVYSPGSTIKLDRLAVETEDWLLDRCRALPNEAAPALDRIVLRLRSLQPVLIDQDPEGAPGAEAQRLIGDHLPSLVSTFVRLPPEERQPGSETARHFADSLGIVANELDDLCERLACDRRIGFDTERRFIESRYRDGSEVSLDKPS
jgi:hypothetical protein